MCFFYSVELILRKDSLHLSAFEEAFEMTILVIYLIRFYQVYFLIRKGGGMGSTRARFAFIFPVTITAPRIKAKKARNIHSRFIAFGKFLRPPKKTVSREELCDLLCKRCLRSRNLLLKLYMLRVEEIDLFVFHLICVQTGTDSTQRPNKGNCGDSDCLDWC